MYGEMRRRAYNAVRCDDWRKFNGETAVRRHGDSGRALWWAGTEQRKQRRYGKRAAAAGAANGGVCGGYGVKRR